MLMMRMVSILVFQNKAKKAEKFSSWIVTLDIVIRGHRRDSLTSTLHHDTSMGTGRAMRRRSKEEKWGLHLPKQQ